MHYSCKKSSLLGYGAIVCLLAVVFGFLIPFANDIQYAIFFIVETLVLLSISMFRKSLLISILLIIPLSIEAAQYVSIYSTGDYIIPLTVLNLQNAHDINDDLKIICAIGVAYIIIFYVNIFILYRLKAYSKRRALLAVSSYIIIVIISFFAYNTEQTWKKYPFPLENVSYISFKVIKILSSTPTNKYEGVFKKKFINTNFMNAKTAKKYQNFNVVVIFLEGTSFEVLNENLTPNIVELQKKGINIINYFNHTAATFRGLRGQLISGFCLKGGREYAGDLAGVAEFAEKLERNEKAAPIIESLPYILKLHGYHSVFISPHDKHDRLASVMAGTGFQQVLTAENFGEQFSYHLSDRQSYQFLWEELMKLKSLGKPFLLCLYPLGTHHGMDSPDKKYGDGKNRYLNKFYNADFWLGDFVNKFLSNSISNTTLLILTSDHSTFPTPEYRKTFNSNAQYFIDKIPFIIFMKNIQGETVNARYRNSLSFAPTVLDILGIDDVENHFLGDSIFSNEDDNIYSNISCIGYQCYHTGKDGVRILEDDAFHEVLDLINKFYSFAG